MNFLLTCKEEMSKIAIQAYIFNKEKIKSLTKRISTTSLIK